MINRSVLQKTSNTINEYIRQSKKICNLVQVILSEKKWW